jgi:hypothetical protein
MGPLFVIWHELEGYIDADHQSPPRIQQKERPTTSVEAVAGQLPKVEEPAMPIRAQELASSAHEV